MPARDHGSMAGSDAASGVVDPVKYENCTGTAVRPVESIHCEEPSPTTLDPPQQSTLKETESGNGMGRDGRRRRTVPDFTSVRIPTYFLSYQN
jgi:hypothetical protein